MASLCAQNESLQIEFGEPELISKPEESGTDCLRITSRYYDSLRFESLWNAPALALSF
jgi:hypothetical protein